MNHFFAYINRMRFIQRWALMRNSYTENIQEHSHQVAVLAHALAVLRNEKFGGQVDAGAVAVAALYHDAGEILTGDMPTPIKYYNPAIRQAYKAVEQVAEEKLLGMLPRSCARLRGRAAPGRSGGGGAGQGGGQAVRAHLVHRGAEGRQQRVPSGRHPDRRRHGRHAPAGAGLFPGAFFAKLLADTGRAGVENRASCALPSSSLLDVYPIRHRRLAIGRTQDPSVFRKPR